VSVRQRGKDRGDAALDCIVGAIADEVCNRVLPEDATSIQVCIDDPGRRKGDGA